MVGCLWMRGQGAMWAQRWWPVQRQVDTLAEEEEQVELEQVNGRMAETTGKPQRQGQVSFGGEMKTFKGS